MLADRTEKEAVTLKFVVADTGIGIDPAHHGELFSDFTTISPSYSQKFGGTGLGLAISRKLIDMMGGEIDFESTPEKGSAFWFTISLPTLTSDETLEEELKLTQLPSSARTMTGTVLVAEDNPANQLVTKTILENVGLSVELAGDGAEAVEAVKRRSFDIILMDVGMPEMDGIEATQMIRALETDTKKTPIVAMTAHVMKGDRESLLANGMDDYLAKPASKAQLLAVLDKWLSRGKENRNSPLPMDSAHDIAAGSESSTRIDTTVLDQLAEDTSAELLPDLIKTFVDHAAERLQAIEAAAESNDFERLRDEAHGLKSSAATFGALQLSKLAADLEAAGKAGSVETSIDLAAQTVNEGQIVIDEFKAKTFE